MQFEIEVRPSTAPDGRTMVLVQLPDGYVLIPPDGARSVALALVQVADAIDDAR